MNNCKGTRPWGYGRTSKSKSFTKRPRLEYNCRGNYCCTNAKYANMTDFGINRLKFQQKKGVIISYSCRGKAAYLPWGGRLILEKDTEKRSLQPSITERTRALLKWKVVANVSPKYPKNFSFNSRKHGKAKSATVARATIIFCCCYNCKSYTNKIYTDNIKWKIKIKRRPEEQCFKAAKILKTTFKQEDPHFVYFFNEESDARLPFVLKSRKLNVKLLQNLDKDGNHPLSNETIYLDVLYSTYVMITLSHN